MRPSDFPRDEKFRDPRTPPFRDDRGIYHVFSYADVLTALRDSGSTFSRDPSGWLPPGPHAPTLDFMWLTEPITPDGRPGRHTALRAAAEPWLRTRAIREMEGVVQETAERLVTGVIEEGRGEFNLAEVAQRFSLRVICQLVGIELERETWIREKVDEHMRSTFSDMPVQWDLQSYFWQMVARRLARPRDELLDVLIRAWQDGALSDAELLGYLNGLVMAGTDSTAASMVNTLALSAEFGFLDYARDVLDDDDALRDLIEEAVRFGAPFPAKPISVLRDCRLGGLDIPAGSTLYLWYAAANRDEAVNGGVQQADPRTFDPRRRPNMHLGFGRGRHYCLGADLSRLEGRALVRELSTRLPDLKMSETRPFLRHAGITDWASDAWFTYDAERAAARSARSSLAAQPGLVAKLSRYQRRGSDSTP